VKLAEVKAVTEAWNEGSAGQDARTDLWRLCKDAMQDAPPPDTLSSRKLKDAWEAKVVLPVFKAAENERSWGKPHAGLTIARVILDYFNRHLQASPPLKAYARQLATTLTTDADYRGSPGDEYTQHLRFLAQDLRQAVGEEA
jgi:hypothetical protein